MCADLSASSGRTFDDQALTHETCKREHVQLIDDN
jgi:hypothetical protein